MRNFKIVIQYDGSRYKGWQRQQGKDKLVTVQGKIEDVLSIMTGEAIEVIGCGRTDKGVHAENYVANFHTRSKLDIKYMSNYFYEYLPEDMVVKSIEEVAERFHSRYNVKSKTYLYTLDNNIHRNVFNRRYTYEIKDNLNLKLMQDAAKVLVGTHDFKGFTTLKSEKSTVRTIYNIDIASDKGIIEISLKGDGFLWNMVRIIVGTLLEVGKGQMTSDTVTKILEDKDRAISGPIAPAKGLCLTEVEY